MTAVESGGAQSTGGDLEGARNRLIEASTAEVLETRVFLLARPGDDDWPIERLKMTDDLSEQFSDVLQGDAAAHTEDLLVPYSAGRMPGGGEAAVLMTDAVPHLTDLLSTMEGEVADVGDFDVRGELASDVRIYIVSVRHQNPGWIHGIRVKSMTSLRPTRSRKVAALWTDGLFDKLERDPLVFDDTFDAFVVGTQVVVVRQRNFERGLEFLAAAQAEAETILRSATANLAIANIDEFVSAARSDVNMLAKLRGINEKMQRDPAYATHLTMANILAFRAQNPGVELDVEGDPGQETLVFHREPARRWRIFKLLDDDYLHSQLTDLNYEVNSKDLL